MNPRPAIWLVAAGVAAADQAVKMWALSDLQLGQRIDVWGDKLGFELAFNSGAALSILNDRTWIVTAIMVGVAAYLVWAHGRARGPLGILVFGLALGGAVGNLGDRIFRQPGFLRGAVVDMINYNDWFVGNVADIAIVAAAAIAIVVSWSGKTLLWPRHPAAGAAPE